jgi:hypothetical protein
MIALIAILSIIILGIRLRNTVGSEWACVHA